MVMVVVVAVEVVLPVVTYEPYIKQTVMILSACTARSTANLTQNPLTPEP